MSSLFSSIPVESQNVLLYAYAMRHKRLREQLQERIDFLQQNPEMVTDDDLQALSEADGRVRRWLLEKHPEIRKRLEDHLVSPAVISGSFHEFVKRAYRHTKLPGQYIDGWHLRALCTEWEAVQSGDTKRLMVNIPPSCAKSLIANVLYPAWAWSRDPEYRVACYSYNEDLPKRDGKILATLVNSDWYRRNFPAVRLIQDSEQMLMTSAGGWRFGAGVGGTVTGLHPHLISIDDPSKASDVVNRPAAMAKVVRWYASSLSTRGMVLKCSIGITMQRLAVNDLCGVILRENQFGGDEHAGRVSDELDDGFEWRHVCLPMFYNPDHRYLYEHDPRTKEGEIIWPEALTVADMNARIREMELDPENGGLTTAAQMGQDPLSVAGALFENLGGSGISTQDLPKKLRHGRFVRSIDFATQEGGGDYTATVLLCEYDGVIYVVDALRFQKGPNDRNRLLCEIAKQDAARYGNYRVAGEKSPGHGKEVYETLHHRLSKLGIQSMGMPTGNKSKTARATAVAAAIKYGEVRILTAIKEYGTFMNELKFFPGAKHDDWVDALAHGYKALELWRDGKI